MTSRTERRISWMDMASGFSSWMTTKRRASVWPVYLSMQTTMSILLLMDFMVLSHVVWPNTPVILLSDDTEDLSDYVIERGAFAWVPEPYDTQHVLSMLRSATQQSPEDRWKQALTRMSCLR